MTINIELVDWDKVAGLVPAVVQHWQTGEVLMLGYMDREAIAETSLSGHVTFFSRSKQRLWTKGESSGHYLNFKSLHLDCDADALLVRADPIGPTCHNGTPTCFADAPALPLAFLGELSELVRQREAERPSGSYTTTLFEAGVRKIAQKVGEEGVETALAGVVQEDGELLGESADLIFHLMVLLRARGLDLSDVARVLASRHR
jgi:phosphoribosyl-ATP pyrophosphohydrolase/phosphoribosyl-AMP cyclohydrolase